ncbi:MAG TPA: Hsp20/alpha crystallin family protein, partial [Candidatus Ozemobacteraceae bacterium]|nr:Hsp20/alpha crystallin family protein [Candidatus Ozemobacteraceae bacterium]
MAEKTVPEIKKETPVIQREVTRNREYFATPLVDIYETNDGLTVMADLPGVTKEGLKVQVEDGILTIEGKAPISQREGLLVKEYEPTSFFRQFELSENVAQDK